MALRDRWRWIPLVLILFLPIGVRGENTIDSHISRIENMIQVLHFLDLIRARTEMTDTLKLDQIIADYAAREKSKAAPGAPRSTPPDSTSKRDVSARRSPFFYAEFINPLTLQATGPSSPRGHDETADNDPFASRTIE